VTHNPALAALAERPTRQSEIDKAYFGKLNVLNVMALLIRWKLFNNTLH
jgi:hypothetical protein